MDSQEILDHFCIYECCECRNIISNSTYLEKKGVLQQVFNISIEDYLVKCKCGLEIGIKTEGDFRVNFSCLSTVPMPIDQTVALLQENQFMNDKVIELKNAFNSTKSMVQELNQKLSSRIGGTEKLLAKFEKSFDP